MYANPSCPAHDPCDLLRLLHGPHRVACRLLMILLSQQGMTAGQIADLLGYDPSTVRRWIHRYQRQGTNGLADRPRGGRPRLGSPRLGQRILQLLSQPKAWTISRLHQRLDHPAISLRTLHRRVREVACWRRPRLVAKGDPDRPARRPHRRWMDTTSPRSARHPPTSVARSRHICDPQRIDGGCEPAHQVFS